MPAWPRPARCSPCCGPTSLPGSLSAWWSKPSTDELHHDCHPTPFLPSPGPAGPAHRSGLGGCAAAVLPAGLVAPHRPPHRRSPPPLGPLALRTAVAWAAALLLFFPLGWLLLTAFKTELQAISVAPLLWFTPTLENFHEVQERSDYLLYAGNSVITSVLSTLLGLLLAAPAAYAMAFFKGRYTKDILMWMLSTKMMPAVGALVPIYVLAQKSQLLDTRLALIIVFTLSNLPIMVWMLYSHFKDIPHEILEAARM